MKMDLALLSVFFVLSGTVFAFAEGPNAWDALRPVSDFGAQLDIPVKWFLFALSTAILVISLLAYKKSKSKRILLISFAFLVFSLKAVLKLFDIYISPGNFFASSSNDVADFMVMLLIFVAIFYRKQHERIFESDSK